MTAEKSWPMFFIQFCDVAKLAIIKQEDLAIDQT
jgi:hypothetical protein